MVYISGRANYSTGGMTRQGRLQMKRYDIVFMGHFAKGTIVPFKGSGFAEWGGPIFFGPLAASCLTKRIAAVTRIAESDEKLLEPLRTAGIDLFVQHRETVQMLVVHPNVNVDERQIFVIKCGGHFCIDDVPPIAPCLIHLGGLSAHEFPLEFLQALKARGFRLSADIQSFVWQVDEQTQLIHWEDVPEKREILRMVDFVKLDVMEAKTLTGTDVLEDQADILEDWGSSETVITCSDGVLARSEGKTMFVKFTNTNVQGRTGRGDTFSGAYLARRLDHSIEDSLRFAAALTSIKVESPGPFRGSLEDVIKKMGDPLAC
jgi:sugar/nucleoside kinase (ribokinase family)